MSDNQSVSTSGRDRGQPGRLASTIGLESPSVPNPSRSSSTEAPARPRPEGRYHALMGTGQARPARPCADDRGPSRWTRSRPRPTSSRRRPPRRSTSSRRRPPPRSTRSRPRPAPTTRPSPRRLPSRPARRLPRRQLQLEHRPRRAGPRRRPGPPQARRAHHDEYGELRTDRIALGLAALGAVLIGAGVASARISHRAPASCRVVLVAPLAQ